MEPLVELGTYHYKAITKVELIKLVSMDWRTAQWKSDQARTGTKRNGDAFRQSSVLGLSF